MTQTTAHETAKLLIAHGLTLSPEAIGIVQDGIDAVANQIRTKLAAAEAELNELRKKDFWGWAKQVNDLQAQNLSLVNELSALREACKEVMQWHSDKRSPEYNECDTEPCAWCSNVRQAIDSARK